jgi:hypothetical protein
VCVFLACFPFEGAGFRCSLCSLFVAAAAAVRSLARSLCALGLCLYTVVVDHQEEEEEGRRKAREAESAHAIKKNSFRPSSHFVVCCFF